MEVKKQGHKKNHTLQPDSIRFMMKQEEQWKEP